MEGYFARRVFSRFHDVHAVYGIVRLLCVYCCLAAFCRARPDAGLTLKSLFRVTFSQKVRLVSRRRIFARLLQDLWGIFGTRLTFRKSRKHKYHSESCSTTGDELEAHLKGRGSRKFWPPVSFYQTTPPGPRFRVLKCFRIQYDFEFATVAKIFEN